MNEQLISSLKEYGLSEKEAKIYLVTLELGSAPASTIARRAGIKRVTAYALLQDLQSRDIAKHIEKSGVKHFQVIGPDELLERLKDQYESFKDKVPALAGIADKYHNKPKIEYFEGLSGVKEMYDELLNSSTDICSFLGTHEIDPELLEYLYEDFLPRRVEAGIPARVIVSTSEENKQYISKDKKNLKQTIMIDHELFDIVSGIDLYGPDKVMFSLFSEEEMSGVIVHSKKLYKSLQSVFELVWSNYASKK